MGRRALPWYEMDEPHPEPPKSYGNMSDDHWSRTRGERNREAIDYYRERSKAPGVAAGGEARNFYCMECDGVVPFEHGGDACPHCGAEITGRTRRYFNWVEIDQPGEGDFKALLPWLLGGLIGVAFFVWFLAEWVL